VFGASSSRGKEIRNSATSNTFNVDECSVLRNGLDLRLRIQEESSLPPFVKTKAPSRGLHLMVFRQRRCWSFTDDVKEGLAMEERHVLRLCQHFGVSEIKLTGSRARVELGDDMLLRYDLHTEYSQISIIRYQPPDYLQGSDPSPFDNPITDILPDGWLDKMPGQILMAMDMVVESAKRPLDGEGGVRDVLAVGGMTKMHAYAAGPPVMGASYADGTGRIFTTGNIYSDGCSRVLVQYFNPNNMMNLDPVADRCSRGLELYLDLEAYRIMLLLAYSRAKELALQIDRISADLIDLVTRMEVSGNTADTTKLLGELCVLSKEAEETYDSYIFRFTGSKAHHRLVEDKLRRLNMQPIMWTESIRDVVRYSFIYYPS